jgi:hypothetical protein
MPRTLPFGPRPTDPMGVFVRPDSPVWWLWLETTSQKERTDIRIGTTTIQKRDSRARRGSLSPAHERARGPALQAADATPAIRFAKYAETYRPTRSHITKARSGSGSS